MKKNRYSVVGHYLTDLVYKRLGPGILDELVLKSPKNEKGNRPNKLHQWLTEDIGDPMLAQHLHSVVMFQRLAIANGILEQVHSDGRSSDAQARCDVAASSQRSQQLAGRIWEPLRTTSPCVGKPCPGLMRSEFSTPDTRTRECLWSPRRRCRRTYKPSRAVTKMGGIGIRKTVPQGNYRAKAIIRNQHQGASRHIRGRDGLISR